MLHPTRVFFLYPFFFLFFFVSFMVK